MECYNRHHQKEEQPFTGGTDDVFQSGQAVYAAVQVSNHLRIVEGQKSLGQIAKSYGMHPTSVYRIQISA